MGDVRPGKLSPEWEAALAAANWTIHALADVRILRGTFFLPSRPSLSSCLDGDGEWAFFWKARGQDDIWVGREALLSLRQDQLRRLFQDPTIVCFGVQPFDAASPESDLWGELSESSWFVPRIAWKLSAQSCLVHIHGILEGDDESAFGHLKSDLCDRFRRTWSEHEGGVSLPRGAYDRRELPAREEWVRQVRKICSEIEAGKLQKLVLARAVRLEFSEPLSWIAWLEAFHQSTEQSYIFGIKTPTQRAFVGRSPERLLAWDRDRFAIDAIAGTRRRGGDRESDEGFAGDLKRSAKDSWEHNLVGTTIEQVLLQMGLPFRRTISAQLLQLQHMQHMVTQYEGSWTSDPVAFDLLSKLHPTPAVGGVPTQDALAILKVIELIERGPFAGYIGMVGEDCAEVAIAIRSALLTSQTMHLFAGAGIVAQSDPDKEWEETDLKLLNFLSQLYQARESHQGDKIQDMSRIGI